MSRELYKDAFEPDGMLRDIYVFDTDARDWQKVIDDLRANSYPLEFTAGGEPMPLPDVARIFELRRELSCSLSIDRPSMSLMCYFFTTDQIEFDLDPRDFTDEQQIDRLLVWMRSIGELLDKPVVLTPESSPDRPLLRFDPAHGRTERL